MSDTPQEALIARIEACLETGMDPDQWPEPAWELLREAADRLRASLPSSSDE